MRRALTGAAIILSLLMVLAVGRAWGHSDGLDAGICVGAMGRMPADEAAGMFDLPQPECEVPPRRNPLVERLGEVIDSGLDVDGGGGRPIGKP